MPVRVLTDCAAYIGPYDFTGDTNEATFDMSADVKDITTFASGGWRQKIAGLRDAAILHKGFWQSATSQAVDPEIFPDLGVADRVYTWAPYEETPADPMPFTDQQAAFFCQGIKLNYKPMQGAVGDTFGFELGSQNSGRSGVVKGSLIVPRRTVAATGKVGVTWDSIFGAPAAGQSLYAVFHVFVPGTTITVQVQSDDNTGFTTPTTQATIGPITTASATWVTPIAGPITDRYWRFNVSAITGTFHVAGAIGVR
jgi:hypothetical protein